MNIRFFRFRIVWACIALLHCRREGSVITCSRPIIVNHWKNVTPNVRRLFSYGSALPYEASPSVSVIIYNPAISLRSLLPCCPRDWTLPPFLGSLTPKAYWIYTYTQCVCLPLARVTEDITQKIKDCCTSVINKIMCYFLALFKVKTRCDDPCEPIILPLFRKI